MWCCAKYRGWAVIEKANWAPGDASVPVLGGVYDSGQGRNRWTVRGRNQNKNISSYQSLPWTREHRV